MHIDYHVGQDGIKSSSELARPTRRRKASSTTRQGAVPNFSDQQEVLALVLGTHPQLSSLTAWLEASPSEHAPVQITGSMVDTQLVPSIQSKHYLVLHHLRHQGIFHDDAWCVLQQLHTGLIASAGKPPVFVCVDELSVIAQSLWSVHTCSIVHHRVLLATTVYIGQTLHWANSGMGNTCFPRNMCCLCRHNWHNR